eukprot:TRINITY_DN83506_c0_g1_i1.p1 TRINITY_DN83506_c0_g1~~TRINITY_DN83506_c0_g1_i1.p1  ORF type:complete len:166 (-),score=17.64 TRINITY_DN83506_c0_g1_i1:75-572(-)
MEPHPVLDGDNAFGGTWVQNDDAVTITVVLPDLVQEAGVKPQVSIKPEHLKVTLPGMRCNMSDLSELSVASDEDEVVIFDHALSGPVSTDGSAWTLSDATLIIDLAKREGESRPRLWWPSAVKGGKTGPDDPKAPKGPIPKRLDGAIGSQVSTKKNFEGKSKFQW